MKFLWLLLFSPFASADLAREVEASRARIEKTEVRQREVLAALYDLNRKIRKTVSERAKLQGERGGLEDSVRRLNRRIAELDESSRVLRGRLTERLKAIHRLGGTSLARVLTSASSSSSLDRNLKILGLVAARDRNLFQEYAMLRTETKIKQTRLASRLERLREVERTLSDREKRLVAEQDVKNKLLNGIRRKHLFAEKSLDELRRRTADAPNVDDAVLDLLFRPSFADHRGELPPPVPGRTVKIFGPERGIDQGWTLTHKGIQLAAKTGEAVKAVFDGTVAWVGRIPGFGETVVIDHGDHYYTVYGNARDVQVPPGQEIRQTQTVASADADVYFEIRHFSEPYDPQLWLKGSTL